MFPAGVVPLVERTIAASPSAAALCLTGGGTQAAAWLTNVAGASSKIMEIKIPYAKESTIEYLGGEPKAGFCAVDTAFHLAKRAYGRAAALGPLGVPLYGISASCALATNRPKKGNHEIFVGMHHGNGSKVYVLQLEKGLRSRVQEDEVASRMVVGALGELCLQDDGVVNEILKNSLVEGERLEVESKSHEDAIDALLSGKVDCVELYEDKVVADAPRHHQIVVPGSFNPLHEGHIGMLEVGKKLVGKSGMYELTVCNPDKGMLSREEVMKRVEQFTSMVGSTVVLSRKKLFVDKAMLFENCTFVVGYDTAIRLVNPKYHGESVEGMYKEFDFLRRKGCSFLVVGRLEDGVFKGLENMDLPVPLADLFESVPEREFRIDISSTQLRKEMESES